MKLICTLAAQFKMHLLFYFTDKNVTTKVIKCNARAQPMLPSIHAQLFQHQLLHDKYYQVNNTEDKKQVINVLLLKILIHRAIRYP